MMIIICTGVVFLQRYDRFTSSKTFYRMQCIYNCYGAGEDMRNMAVILGFLILLSIFFHLILWLINNDISNCSIVFTFFVAVLDMCNQLCLDVKVLRSKRVNLTWFHVMKVVIQSYKTLEFSTKIKDVWGIYENQKLRPNLCVELSSYLARLVCFGTFFICVIGAGRKLF